MLHNSHALLAFFALSNADVIVARSVLDPHDSGLYAGGLILAKAVLFLPQFVVVLVFPAMAASGGERRVQNLGLAFVGAIGAVATVGAWLLSGLAVLFIGGDDYVDLEPRIWAFAAIGTLLSMLQILVYGSVARQHRSAVWVLWSGVVALVLVALAFLDSLDGLLTAAAAVQLTVLVLLVAIGGRGAPGPTTSTEPVSARPRAS